MRLFKMIPDNTNLPFMKWRFWAVGISAALLVASVGVFFAKGLNFGVDFAGGLMIEVGFEQPADLDDLRGKVNSLGIGEGSIQEFGAPEIVSIRLPLPEGEDDEAVQRVVTSVQQSISGDYPDANFRRVETVSGKVSGELVRDGTLAAGLAMLAVAAYIWFRFEWQFGVGGLVSLIHDVFLTIGFFAWTQLEFNLNTVAAILTIIGYSLNDTIVNYDRIRENLRKYRKMDIVPLLDLSINEMLARTTMTSVTMILALGALVIWGGDVLFGFSVAMLLGIFIGTFSSIYIAGPLLLWMGVSPNTFVAPEVANAAAGAERTGNG
ncbi:protein translocase subunit SecF [Sphingosinicella soli]|uniref:Protein-export membrane protein SecF n=1 Tax=Sphingosinicella soli TaxID=333708 RepID=A0A7W7B2P9_9SPHN|nr:protein translocase subunit SecF [Sphingosinicella soli]MBB4632759.1 preprotein translocase subunit SecF [Sphingosinicella soli]